MDTKFPGDGSVEFAAMMFLVNLVAVTDEIRHDMRRRRNLPVILLGVP